MPDEVIENYKESGNFLFRWESIKWYEGYPEIDCLNDFMDECDGLEVETTSTAQSSREDRTIRERLWATSIIVLFASVKRLMTSCREATVLKFTHGQASTTKGRA